MIGKGAVRIERVSIYTFIRDGWFIISSIYVQKKCKTIKVGEG